MIDPKSHELLRAEIKRRLHEDAGLLDQLRQEIRPLRQQSRRIMPRSTTSIALVATDGGNNKLKFDPFLVQLVRVVDSSNNEHCLEAITPTTDTNELSANQFNSDGTPRTPLGAMMRFLDVDRLSKLSPMIREFDPDEPRSPSWVQVYRELVEWAVLFTLVCKKDFATDTLIVFDGLLRSKVFKGDLFHRLLEGFRSEIQRHQKDHRRNIWLAGVAKHSKVLDRYNLAMSLEGVLQTDFPAYVEIDREIEKKAYIWSEYARGNADQEFEGEINKFVGGKMFFVKFGSGRFDPIWPIDIFEPQVKEAATIIGSMLEDAKNGFPVPHYPSCLQKAHQNAALVDFDFDILQDEIVHSIRGVLGPQAPSLDVFLLRETDPARSRYD